MMLNRVFSCLYTATPLFMLKSSKDSFYRALIIVSMIFDFCSAAFLLLLISFMQRRLQVFWCERSKAKNRTATRKLWWGHNLLRIYTYIYVYVSAFFHVTHLVAQHSWLVVHGLHVVPPHYDQWAICPPWHVARGTVRSWTQTCFKKLF